MTGKLVDMHKYKKTKNDYEKLLKRNPFTLLTFQNFVRVRDFIEEVNRTKLMKSKTNPKKEDE